MPCRYCGDMCCSPSTSLPDFRCSLTSSSLLGARSSIGVATTRSAFQRVTLDLRTTQYSLHPVRSSVDERPLLEAVDEGVLTLTLNRPEHRNALDAALRDALARAKEALLGGDDLDAAEALRLGLVMELTDGEVIAAAHERARRMLRRAPLSFGAAKRLLHVAADTDTHSTMVAESLAQTALLATADHREGLAAARERREPEFNGR